MLRRSLLIAGIGLLPTLGSSTKARAQLSIQEAKAAALPTAPHASRTMGDPDQQRIHSLMLKDGYTLQGDMRRKGQMFTMVAEREGVTWRLVVDGVSGELIGRKMVGMSVGHTD